MNETTAFTGVRSAYCLGKIFWRDIIELGTAGEVLTGSHLMTEVREFCFGKVSLTIHRTQRVLFAATPLDKSVYHSIPWHGCG